MSALVLASSASAGPWARLQQALKAFESCLTPGQLAEFKRIQKNGSPSAADVITVTADIDRKAGSRHKAWKCRGPRLTKVLTAIQRFAAAGDVMVGASQNLIAGALWSAVRISLQIAIGSSAYFDKLSLLLMEIGRTAPIHDELGVVFPTSDVLRDLFTEWTIRMVQVSIRVVEASKKNIFSLVASTGLGTFNADYGGLKEELTTLGSLIDKQVLLLSNKAMLTEFKESSKSRQALSLFTQEATRRAREEKIFHLLRTLSPNQHLFEDRRIRERRKGSPQWILREAAYQQWRSVAGPAFLSVTGKIGCGKTVALANIVDDLHLHGTKGGTSTPTDMVAYVFADVEVSDTLTARWILGNFATQILRHSSVHKSFLKSADDLTVFDVANPSTESIKALLATLLRAGRLPRLFLILDGLDQCPRSEIDLLSSFLKEVVAQNQDVKVCCSARDDGLGNQLLRGTGGGVSSSHQFRILYSADHSDELNKFLESEVPLRVGALRSPISKHTQDIILEILTKHANGMYLWVATLLDVLFPSFTEPPSEIEMLALLEEVPRDLARVLDLAISHLIDTTHSRKLFQLTAAATRPLKIEEMQEAISVQPGNLSLSVMPEADNIHRLIQVSGGHLVVIDESTQTVHFAHHSILAYFTECSDAPRLCRPLFFTDEEAIDIMAAVCLTYLRSPQLRSEVATQQPGLISDASKLTDIAVESTKGGGIFGRVASRVQLLAARTERSRSLPYDMAPILRQHQESRMQQRQRLVFFSYAKQNWLAHCKGIERLKTVAPSIYNWFVEFVWDCIDRRSWTETSHVDLRSFKLDPEDAEPTRYWAATCALHSRHHSLLAVLLRETIHLHHTSGGSSGTSRTSRVGAILKALLDYGNMAAAEIPKRALSEIDTLSHLDLKLHQNPSMEHNSWPLVVFGLATILALSTNEAVVFSQILWRFAPTEFLGFPISCSEDLSVDGCTPMCLILRMGQSDAASWAVSTLERRHDLETNQSLRLYPCTRGCPCPMVEAFRSGSDAIYDYLLAAGAHLSIVSTYGETILQQMARSFRSRTEVYQAALFLSQSRVDINETGAREPKTPAHICVDTKNPLLFCLLLQENAELDFLLPMLRARKQFHGVLSSAPTLSELRQQCSSDQIRSISSYLAATLLGAFLGHDVSGAEFLDRARLVERNPLRLESWKWYDISQNFALALYSAILYGTASGRGTALKASLTIFGRPELPIPESFRICDSQNKGGHSLAWSSFLSGDFQTSLGRVCDSCTYLESRTSFWAKESRARFPPVVVPRSPSGQLHRSKNPTRSLHSCILQDFAQAPSVSLSRLSNLAEEISKFSQRTLSTNQPHTLEYWSSIGVAGLNAYERVTGDTALLWASMLNLPEHVRMLLRHGADPNGAILGRYDHSSRIDCGPLLTRTHGGRASIEGRYTCKMAYPFPVPLPDHCEPLVTGMNPFNTALLCGNFGICAILAEYRARPWGPDVSWREMTRLFVLQTTRSERLEMQRILKDHGFHWPFQPELEEY